MRIHLHKEQWDYFSEIQGVNWVKKYCVLIESLDDNSSTDDRQLNLNSKDQTSV